MKVYRLRHRETGKFLKSYKGRTMWMQKVHFERTREYKENKDNYEIVEYELVESTEYNELQEIIKGYEKTIEVLEKLPIDIDEVIE